MKRLTLILLAIIILISESSYGNTDSIPTNWAYAKWIALERLEDNMKIVPAVHGNGNKLGNKGKKRSVVPMFRKSFIIGQDISKATINISGLGHYELTVNGEKTGDRFLSPGWTYYQKRCFYNTYDITNQLKKGENALGVLVGNGFYNVNRERYRKLVVAYGYPRLIFNISVTLKNGETINIVSDENCRVTPSPITFSSIYGGEDYDATLEQPGWNKIGFNDSSWQTPVIINESIGVLEQELDYPLKVMQEFKSQNFMISKTGKTICDFGQNASGIIALKVRGNRGARITLRPDELIDSLGNITQRSSGGPYELNYILSGNGVETWQPRFTYYGFRYAEVEITEPANSDQKTEILELKMLHTRNSSPTVGSFSCSDTLLNRIFTLIDWGIRSNMASVPTDCPHREKLGWLEETYLIGPSMHYNYYIHAFFSKTVTDMMDSQLKNGLVPDIAPEYVPFAGGFRDSPEWGSASVIIPWQLYQWYGDTAVLGKSWPMIKKYISYLKKKSKRGILNYGLGDWYDLGPKSPGEAQLTPKALTATSIYYHDLNIATNIARLLSLPEDAKKIDKISKKVKRNFLSKFYESKTGVCSTGSQTAYAMPLYTGLIPNSDREKVLGNLVNSIIKSDYALTAGDIGYHFLVRVLSENGRSDILYNMNNRIDRPGYGFQLKKGATALTESWAALAESSNNHMMLGHLMEWFYNGLGGINQAKNSVAYSDIIIAPKPVGNIKWVKCSYQSVKGVIASSWEKDDNIFTLMVEIPPHTSAKIILPDEFRNSKLEVTDTERKSPVEINSKSGEFKINSGSYRIVASKL